MVNANTVHFDDITADKFERFFSSLTQVDRHQCELVFPGGMIERICKEKKYHFYTFAHDLEGNPYVRVRINLTTLEFLVRRNKEKQNLKESLLLQINHNYQIIYRRPQKPTETIYVEDY